MEKKESYFGEIGSAFKTLATGLKTTMKEYFTPKSTEQYPENRKTTLHVAPRHRGRLVFKQYDLGDCMFCQLCVNACNFDAIKFTNDFENAVFDRSKLVLHLNEEVYKGGSLPNLIDGGADWEVGTFNTKKK